MKYFTPELYRRGNSEDDAEVDAVEREWHFAVQQYRKYLRKNTSRMPLEVRRLATQICLHDGRIVRVTKSSITVWLNEVLYTIEFKLDTSVPQPKHGAALVGHPFDRSGHFWLYDELELLDSGAFLFEVLLSNGRILRFRFRDVTVWELGRPNNTSDPQTVANLDLNQPKLTLAKLRKLVLGKPSRGTPRITNGKRLAK
jgi:hypothetical protein